MALLRAAVRLAGEEPPAESRAVLDRFEVIAGISTRTFHRVLGHARGDAKMPESEAVTVTSDYLASVAELVRWVNAQGPP